MATLPIPKYLKIHDIQKIIKCIFCSEKRPRYLQLIPKPTQIVVALINSLDIKVVSQKIYKESSETKSRPFVKNDSDKGKKKTVSINQWSISQKAIESKFHSFLSSLGFVRAYLNESVKIDDLYKNIMKNVDINKISYSYITPSNLSLIDRHDINHLFSYTRFVSSQIDFDCTVFDSYIRPYKKSPYFLIALDCEMMICKNGKQVGRVSMLDHTGNVIYDKFIQPESHVIDYVEKYSGLNYKNTSSGIQMAQMKKEILEIIGIDTVVLGHGLENDLEHLQLYTENLIDTAYLFLNTDGHKLKLCNLSKAYFNSQIQKLEHDPREDALCCLKLLSYKIAEQLNFLDPNGELLDINVKYKEIQDETEIENECKNERVIYFMKGDTINILNKEWLFYFVLVNEGGKDYVYFKQTV